MPSDIKITAEFDTKAVAKEIKSLEKEIKKLENKQLPLINEFEQLRQKAAQAKQAIADADKALASGKIDKVDRFTIEKEATASIETYTSKIEELRNKIEGLDNQIVPLKTQLESLKFTGSADNSLSEVGIQAKANLQQAADAAGKMSKELASAKSKSDSLGKSVGNVDTAAGKATSGMRSKMSSSLKSVEGSFKSFGKRIGNTLKSAFVFSVLYKGLNELKQKLSALMSTNQQVSNSLAQIKSNLAVAFQPIYQAALPAITALLNLLVKASAYLAAFTNALFGTSMSSSISAAREMQSTINAVESGASGASKAEKELTAAIKEKQKQVKALQKENKQLQREYEQQKKAVEAQTDAIEKQITALEKSIDSVQKMEDAANKAAQAQREAIQKSIDLLEEQQESLQKRNQEQQKAIDSQVKSLQKQQKALDKQYSEQTDGIDDQIKSLEKEIKTIQKAQKAAEKAEKANEKFTAGFDELSTLGAPDTDDPYDAEIEKLQENIDLLQEQKDSQAEAYQAQREYIQEQIDALQEEKEAISEKYDVQNEKIQEQIELLQQQQDAIKDADFSAGIEMYESRIASLREKIDELNASVEENPLIEQNELAIEKLQEEIDLLQEQKDAIQASSDALSGFDTSGLETNLENTNDELEKFVGFTEDVFEFIQVAGGLAAIGGIIWGVIYAVQNFSTIWTTLKGVLTPFLHSKLGIFALIVSGLALIVTAAGNGQEMINNLKYTFEGLGNFIKGVFTGDLETAKDGIIQMLEGLCNIVAIILESAVNLIIRGINWVIEKINSINFTVPDWVPEIGGSQIHPNITPLNEWTAPKYDIPALAQGAVLPPNKPFLALLSDQKQGTNIEAPASLIEDIMRNVMAEQEYNFNISAEGSLGTLIRLLNLQIKRENERKTAF